MTRCWDDRENFLLKEAERDLLRVDGVRPCLLAFRGEESLVCAFLREPPKGEDVWSLIEVAALTQALGADRLAFSVSGRAWSFDDPIVPVAGDVDLRQRIVQIITVDGHRQRAVRTETVHPFEIRGGEVRWDEPLELGPSEGYVGHMLELGVRERHQLVRPLEEVRDQAMRCVALGHLIALDPKTSDRLGFGPEHFDTAEV
ncbi:MAG: hypothetical protein ACRDUY_05575 [Nitriliruptorales bacterium]